MSPPLPLQAQRRAGFSLAETTIAIAIVSIVVLALVGTLPTALNRLNRASARSADARALESIAGIYQMKDWTEVVADEGTPRSAKFFFDRTGIPVPAGDFWVTFAAAVTVEPAPLLPGESEPNPNLRRLSLELSNRVTEDDPFADPRSLRRYTTLLSKIDR